MRARYPYAYLMWWESLGSLSSNRQLSPYSKKLCCAGSFSGGSCRNEEHDHRSNADSNQKQRDNVAAQTEAKLDHPQKKQYAKNNPEHFTK